MPTSNYILQKDDSSVDLWVNARLTFDTTSSLPIAKNVLRQALTEMKPLPDRMLTATLTTLDEQFFDVENVLIYNVGSGAFSAHSQHGLCFKRIHAVPQRSPTGESFAYHHRYEIVELPSVEPNSERLRFGFPLRSFSSNSKPHEIWYAAHENNLKSDLVIGGPFEMTVTLHGPNPVKNLASVIKPLLDGIISSFHTESKIDDHAVHRLAEKTSWNPDDIALRLLNPARPLLGKRNLLSSYRNFVKWNPADELCESCTLMQIQSDLKICVVNIH